MLKSGARDRALSLLEQPAPARPYRYRVGCCLRLGHLALQDGEIGSGVRGLDSGHPASRRGEYGGSLAELRGLLTTYGQDGIPAPGRLPPIGLVPVSSAHLRAAVSGDTEPGTSGCVARYFSLTLFR